MFNESIKMALDGMLTNKLRTFLTLLGIIIGVGAVIAMVSLGFGVKEQIKKQYFQPWQQPFNCNERWAHAERRTFADGRRRQAYCRRCRSNRKAD